MSNCLLCSSPLFVYLLQLGGVCDHISFCHEADRISTDINVTHENRLDKRTVYRIMEKVGLEEDGYVIRDVKVREIKRDREKGCVCLSVCLSQLLKAARPIVVFDSPCVVPHIVWCVDIVALICTFAIVEAIQNWFSLLPLLDFFASRQQISHALPRGDHGAGGSGRRDQALHRAVLRALAASKGREGLFARFYRSDACH
jgi:hypothetical protein